MASMLYQVTPSGSSSDDEHGVSEENPAIVAAEKRSISQDTQLQIAAMMVYLDTAKQVLIERPQLVRDLRDMLAATNLQPPPPTFTNPPQMTTQALGVTAMEQMQVDMNDITNNYGKRRSIQNLTNNHHSPPSSPQNPWQASTDCSCSKKHLERHEKWLRKTRNTLMVVAILIATITFQAALNPPGGVWQDWGDSPDSSSSSSGGIYFPPEAAGLTNSLRVHIPGNAIKEESSPCLFTCFMISDTMGLVASLSIILLLTGAIPIRGRPLMWVLVVIMWIAVCSVILAFLVGIWMIAYGRILRTVIGFTIAFIVVFFVLVFLGNFVRLVIYLCKNMGLTKKKESGVDEEKGSFSYMSQDDVCSAV